MKYIAGPFTLIDRPLWWHRQGLSQTASGYGNKLTSRYCVLLPGETKPRRLYVTQWSNTGSHYVLIKRVAHYLESIALQRAYDAVRGVA